MYVHKYIYTHTHIMYTYEGGAAELRRLARSARAAGRRRAEDSHTLNSTSLNPTARSSEMQNQHVVTSKTIDV